MRTNNEARPRGWRQGGRAGVGEQPAGRSTPIVPAALAIGKRGKLCIIGKVTELDGRPVLATAWRSQRGTDKAISLPQRVLDYAAAAGAEHFYLRDDLRRRMWMCPLSTFGRGALRADGERYIPLSWLVETPWQEWPYAERVVVLDAEPERGDGPRQLPLNLGGVA